VGAPGPFLAGLLSRRGGSCALRNRRTGSILATRVVPALESATRRTGLLQHTSLPVGEAMVIAPTSAVHTFWMKFPIDILFVARDGRVLKIRPAVPAWRMTGALGAFAVIEMAAGALTRCEVARGDTLEVIPRP
jgi:uncharacterized membrane protein (UPF0127 family)